MPWSHALPDYTSLKPGYGQNLVELAAALGASTDAPLQVIDVGANIGDSTRQILARTPARVLAIEGDSYYLDYLRRNVRDHPAVTVAPVLVTTAADDQARWVPSRHAGTTHFQQVGPATMEAAAESASSLPVAELPRVYPAFDNVRLIKSDTDGYDTSLIPELAATYRESRPVLFFEYDPGLTHEVAGEPAGLIWPKLASLGYDRIGVWTHAGEPLGVHRCAGGAGVIDRLLADQGRRARYLDVAVVHGADATANDALLSLFSATAASNR
jgi:FkbM family methyltransferase